MCTGSCLAGGQPRRFLFTTLPVSPTRRRLRDRPGASGATGTVTGAPPMWGALSPLAAGHQDPKYCYDWGLGTALPNRGIFECPKVSIIVLKSVL